MSTTEDLLESGGLMERNQQAYSQPHFSKTNRRLFRNTDLSPYLAHIANFQPLSGLYYTEDIMSQIMAKYGAKIAYDTNQSYKNTKNSWGQIFLRGSEMVRRKKKLTLEEELIELGKEAEKCEEEIKRLSDRKKESSQLIEQKQMEVLHQAVLKSGKSIDEVISLINNEGQEG